MRKPFTTRPLTWLTALLLVLGTFASRAQTLTEGFETGTKGSYAAASVTLGTGSWTFTDALIANSTSDRFNGVAGARIRGGSIAMNFDKPNGAGTISLNAAQYGNDAAAGFVLQLSTDGGTTYTTIPGTPTALTTTLTPFSYTVNQTGSVRLRISSTNTTSGANPRINVDDVVITDAGAATGPTVTAAPASLTAFTTLVGTPSATQTIAVSGSALTAGVVVTAPAGYEVSLSATSGYAASVTVPQTGGTAASTTIYVRLTGTTAGTYAGNVSVASTGATTQNVAVTGTVTTSTSTAPTITSFTPTTGAAGATVTITGANFTGATGVTLNGVAITGYTVVNATTITFTVPTGAASGTIAVTTPTGTATSTGTFTVPTAGPVPTLSAISPVRAVVGGPAFTMTLTGTNLTATTQVTIGSNTYTAATANAGGTSITINVPASQIATLGQFPITVNNGGTASVVRDFFVVPAATTATFEDFEIGTKGAYATGVATLRSGDWTFTEALLGDQFNDRVNQVRSARIRGGGFIAMNFDKPNGAGTITLSAALYGSDATASFTLEISTDGGTTYTAIPGAPAGLTTTLTPYSFTVNQTGNVRLRIGTTNTTAGSNPRINIDDIIITDATTPTTPLLTAAPASLTAFTTLVGTPSATQSFSITGQQLTADATITAPAGYEVSLSATGTFSASVTVPQASGAIASTTIYVRLTGAAVGTPAGNVTVESTGATTLNVAVTGTVTASTPTAPTITSISPASAAVGATVTITGTDLTGATGVMLNGVAVSGFTVVNGTTITFVVPTGATSGAIAVTTAGGTATSTTTLTVTPAVAAPGLSSISPVRAVVGGPDFTMTLTGTGFTSSTQVTFTNGATTTTYTAATVNAGATSITILVPASQIATVGQFQITANNGGTASVVRDFFVVPAATSQAYEDFEVGTKGAYATGNATLRSGEWTFTEAILGDQFNDRVNQIRSARIRGGGSIAMNFDKPNGAGIITLQAAMYGTDTPTTFTVEISTDGGATYTALAGAPTVLTTTLTTYSFVANVTGNVRLRISSANTTVGSNPRINIDDVNIPNFLNTNPSLALPGLALYPNPAQDRLTVTLPTAGAATVALRDLTGRVVLAEAPLAATGVVALPASLATGTYLLEVRQNGVTAVRRVAKN